MSGRRYVNVRGTLCAGDVMSGRHYVRESTISFKFNSFISIDSRLRIATF